MKEAPFDPIGDTLYGFMSFKVLAEAIKLDLFTTLSGKSVTLREVQKLFNLDPRPAEVLVSACLALGFLQKNGDKVRNSGLAEEHLVSGKPLFLGGIISMLDQRLYLPFHDFARALQTNRALTWGNDEGLFEALTAQPEEQTLFTESMHSLSMSSGKALADAVDFSKFSQVMDVGGASGAYCIELARRYPKLSAVVYDLPAPLEVAKKKIKEAGFENRISLHSGNFFNEALPKGSDVILLSMILHDWTPEKDRNILKKCFDALPPGGIVVISELMMDDDKCGPRSAALESVCMLVETEGRNYTWAEYSEWLQEAGFTQIQRIALQAPGSNGVVIGHKP